MNLTLGSKHYHVSLLALLAVALGLVWWFSRSDATTEADPSRAWMATKDKFHSSVRVLWGEVALHLHREARLNQDTLKLLWTLKVARAQSESLARFADSVRETAHDQALTPAVRRLGEACGEVVNNCEQRRQQLAQALEAEHRLRLLEGHRLALADSGFAGMHGTDPKHFHVAFLTLPKPRKWVVAALGCTLGGFLDQADRLRGCGIGAAGLTIASPTQ